MLWFLRAQPVQCSVDRAYSYLKLPRGSGWCLLKQRAKGTQGGLQRQSFGVVPGVGSKRKLGCAGSCWNIINKHSVCRVPGSWVGPERCPCSVQPEGGRTEGVDLGCEDVKETDIPQRRAQLEEP